MLAGIGALNVGSGFRMLLLQNNRGVESQQYDADTPEFVYGGIPAWAYVFCSVLHANANI